MGDSLREKRGDRKERKERKERGERSERSERSERGERSERSERKERKHRDHGESASHVSSSRRSGANYDNNYLQPSSAAGGIYGSGMTDAQPSRFSLTDQFAATRQEFEFGFDDGASSIWDRQSDVASVYQQQQQLLPPQEQQAAVDQVPTALRGVWQARTFYELLCLAPDAPMDEVRRAYYRAFHLLHPDVHPAKARQVAQVYWALIQVAFETLSDPQRRLIYERDCLGAPDDDSDLPLFVSAYQILEATANRPRLDLDRSMGTFDLAMRIDAEDMFRCLRAGSEPSLSMLKPVDFLTSHSFSVAVPGLGNTLDMMFLLYTPHHLLDGDPRIVLNGEELEKDSDDGEDEDHPIRFDRPDPPAVQNRPTTVTVTSSIYGFMQDLADVPTAALIDRYQPCLPGYIPRDHTARLRDGQVQPLVTLTLQHSLPPTRPGQSSRPIIELESDIIPLPAVGLRVTHCVALPMDPKQSIIQVATKAPIWQGRFPRLSALVQRPTAGGFLQFRVESGDWIAKPDKMCYAFAQFSEVNRRFLSMVLPVALPPRVDLSYTTQCATRSTSLLDPRTSQTVGRKKENASKLGDVSLTVSANAEPGCLGSSAMLSTSLGALLSWPRRLLGKLMIKTDDESSPPPKENEKTSFGRRIRMEAGVSWTTIWASVLTLRCLRTTGRFSAFGFEIGLSAHNLHFSLCWSRLGGQTIRLPFLVCPASVALLRARVALFWSAVVPFATLTAWELLRQHNRATAAKAREARRVATVQQRQAEADEVTFLLADNVQKRQTAEQNTRGGGLVILSAKYGVKVAAPPGKKSRHSNAWGSEEVADTTVAVASLVSDGRLHIPAGLEKSNLLGFWDPAPAVEKVLHVRYSYQGEEGVVEVSGDEGLVLPPVQ
ncbi:uncharacterized protein PG998_007269 [Apiospora kogelbergensis]|uniref:J domain-containing protein n=1 Tax=Apiospora kogelbergensis TaxID=1337665 RepID=A0AAW0QJB2_9PEZI